MRAPSAGPAPAPASTLPLPCPLPRPWTPPLPPCLYSFPRLSPPLPRPFPAPPPPRHAHVVSCAGVSLPSEVRTDGGVWGRRGVCGWRGRLGVLLALQPLPVPECHSPRPGRASGWSPPSLPSLSLEGSVPLGRGSVFIKPFPQPLPRSSVCLRGSSCRRGPCLRPPEEGHGSAQTGAPWGAPAVAAGSGCRALRRWDGCPRQRAQHGCGLVGWARPPRVPRTGSVSQAAGTEPAGLAGRFGRASAVSFALCL